MSHKEYKHLKQVIEDKIAYNQSCADMFASNFTAHHYHQGAIQVLKALLVELEYIQTHEI